MYATETQDDTEPRLDEQLAQDKSGDFKDQLIDELYLAGREVQAAIANQPAPEDAAILRNLLEAVRLSEILVNDAWNAFHR